jgi:hypothetical protein
MVLVAQALLPVLVATSCVVARSIALNKSREQLLTRPEIN